MQTTLLGIGIAVILALIAALAGPHFIDWGSFRSTFEQEASRVVGTPVRITGPIDVRLLPTPSVTLGGFQAVQADETRAFRAREVALELSLGSLVRGEWRATDMRIAGLQAVVGLDTEGRFTWGLMPTERASGNRTPESRAPLAIDRVALEDGELTLIDAASGTRRTLEQVWLNGDLRAPTGPGRGDGGFIVGERRYGFRMSTGRVGEDGSVRARLSLDPADRGVSVEIEGALRTAPPSTQSVAQGATSTQQTSPQRAVPQFDGAITLSRPSGVLLVEGRAVSSEPWRATARMRATSASAAFEQIELQFGPEERAVKLTGDAEMTFGKDPRLEGALVARQADLDRLAGVPAGTRRVPASVLGALVATLGDAVALPMPIRFSVSADAVLLSGAPLQTVRAQLRSDGPDWTLDTLEFRAPGFSSIRASGQLTPAPEGMSFGGTATVEAVEARALMAWLEGRADAASGPSVALKASGYVELAPHRIAVDELKAEFDRKSVSGRLSYAWPEGARTRVDGDLTAAELDIDAAIAFVQRALPGSNWKTPDDVALSLNVARATYAGVDASDVTAKLRFDGNGLVLERAAIGNFAGATVGAQVSIEGPWTAPKGAVTFDLDGKSLDGVRALVRRLWPAAADAADIFAPRLAPAKLRVTVNLDRNVNGGKNAATVRVEGRGGAMRIALNADAVGDATDIAKADAHIDGRFDSDDGAALTQLLGADALIALNKGPGALRINASGPLGGEMKADARATASGLDAAWQGTVAFAGENGFSARGDATLNAADVIALRSLFGQSAGQQVQTPAQPGRAAASTPRPQVASPSIAPAPVVLKARIDLGVDRVSADALAGTAGRSPVSGNLKASWAETPRVDGRLNVDALDATALVAVLAGHLPVLAAIRPGLATQLPTQIADPLIAQVAGQLATDRSNAWPSDPLLGAPFGRISGQIDLRVAKASVMQPGDLRDAQAMLRFSPEESALDDVQGSFADGKLTGYLKLRKDVNGLTADANLSARGVSLGSAFATQRISGRGSAQIELKGSGRSASALVASLGGSGVLTVDSVEISALDPRVFDVAARAAEQNPVVDAARIKGVVEGALAGAPFKSKTAIETTLSVVSGQVRTGAMRVQGDGADLGVTATLDIPQAALDARLVLTGTARDGDPTAGRPEIYVTSKGSVKSPTQTVEVSALVGWLTLKAVESQARQLEKLEIERQAALEAERKALAVQRAAALEAQKRAEAEAARAAERQAALEAERRALQAAIPQQSQGSAAEAAGAGETTASAPPAPPPAPVIDVPLPRAAPSRRPPPDRVATEQAPALPAPIEIRPAPSPSARPPARRPDISSPPPQRGGFWENLFGPQRW